jgi:hypothetical protein
MRYWLVLTALLLGSCGRREAHVADWAGGLVEQPGEYHNPRTGITLRVNCDDGLVHYVARDSTGQELFRDREHASDYQRWALYWTPDGTCWVASSDIGTYIWQPDSTGVYRQHHATQHEPNRPAALAYFSRHFN